MAKEIDKKTSNYRVMSSTDSQHIGYIIKTLPCVGDTIFINNMKIEVIFANDTTIASYNYIVNIEKL